MNKILFFILVNFLFFNSAYAAKNTTYLKCPLMMIENKGKTYSESWWPTGAQLNEFYVKIKEGKKVKISIHKYFTAKDFRKDQKPYDGDGELRNLIFSKENNELKWSNSDSFKTNDGYNVKYSDSFNFKKQSDNWVLTVLEFSEFSHKDPSKEIHIKHKLAGDCETIDKKTHKKLIKG